MTLTPEERADSLLDNIRRWKVISHLTVVCHPHFWKYIDFGTEKILLARTHL